MLRWLCATVVASCEGARLHGASPTVLFESSREVDLVGSFGGGDEFRLETRGRSVKAISARALSDEVVRVEVPADFLVAGDFVKVLSVDSAGGASNELLIPVLMQDPVESRPSDEESQQQRRRLASISSVSPMVAPITGGETLTLSGDFTGFSTTTSRVRMTVMENATAMVAPLSVDASELVLKTPLLDVTEMMDITVIPRGARHYLEATVEVSADGATFSAPFTMNVTVMAPMRMAYVLAGFMTDLGWTYNWNMARRAHAALYGKYVIADSFERQQDDYDSVVVRTLEVCNNNYEMLFGTSFQFFFGMFPTSNADACNFWTNDDGTLNMTRPYPTYMVHATGYDQTNTLSTLFTKIYQLRYVAGVAAGEYLKDKDSKVVGYIAAFPVAEVPRGVNAFTLGCRAANPDCEVKLMWTNVWTDEHIELSAAMKLWVEDGARLITQHSNTLAPQLLFRQQGPPACADLDEVPIRAACMNETEKARSDALPQKGVGIGYSSDVSTFGGDSILTSVTVTWTEACRHYIDQVFGDRWVGNEDYWPGSDDDPNINEVKEFSPQATLGTVSAAMAAYESLKTEGDRVFCGALKMTDGTPVPAMHPEFGPNFVNDTGHGCDAEMVAAGDCCMNDFPGKTFMNFMVEGVTYPSETNGTWGTFVVNRSMDVITAASQTGFYVPPRINDITCPDGYLKVWVTELTPRCDEIIICKVGERLDPTDGCVEKEEEDKNLLSPGIKAFMAILVIFNFCFMGCCCWWTFRYRHRVILKLSQPRYLYILTLGTAITTLSSITPLFQRSTAACQSMLWLYGCGFVITTSTLYVKMQQMNTVVEYSLQMKSSKVKTNHLIIFRAVIIMCTGEVCILAFWWIIAPLEYKRSCTEYEKGGVWDGECLDSVGRCRTEQGPVFVAILAMWHTCCVLAGMYMCYLVRNLPSIMSEGKWVFTTFYSQLQVFVTAVPVLAMVRDSYEVFTILKSLVICVVDLTMLCMIFLPKMMLVYKYHDFGRSAVGEYIARTMSESTQKDTVYEQLRVKGVDAASKNPAAFTSQISSQNQSSIGESNSSISPNE